MRRSPGDWGGRSLPVGRFQGASGPFGADYGVIQATQRGITGLRSATGPVIAGAIVRLRPSARRSRWGEIR